MEEVKNTNVEEKVESSAPEYDFDRREIMRYRVNGFSYKLGLLGMVCSLLGAFICLNSMNPNNFQVILIILLNVIVLLGGFLAAERVKTYSAKGALAQLVFGGICAARIFYIPLIIIINYAKYMGSFVMKDGVIEITDGDAHKEAIKYLGATITSKYEGNVANSYLPTSGYFRGIAAMVLFGVAAVCFIIGGLVGLKRAKTLENYINSVEKN